MEQEKENCLTMEDILQLMDRFDQSGLQSFSYQRDGEKLKMSRKPAESGKSSTESRTPFQPEAVSREEEASSGEDVKESPEKPEAHVTAVTAPLAGIFYRSPKPGETPYVQEGQQVRKGETLGLMEAMKMMNEVPSPCSGVIHEIQAEDGAFAEFHATLMTIEESGDDV